MTALPVLRVDDDVAARSQEARARQRRQRQKRRGRIASGVRHETRVGEGAAGQLREPVDDAVRHAVAAGDMSWAARLIEQYFDTS